MKKFLHFGFSALVLGLFFTSCNNDDDYNTIESVDKIKIDSVRIVNDTMDVFRKEYKDLFYLSFSLSGFLWV
jgi:hypothetical protein